MGAGAGSFAVIKMIETEGVDLSQSRMPDAIAAHFAEISDISTAKALQGAFEQTQNMSRRRRQGRDQVSRQGSAALPRYGRA